MVKVVPDSEQPGALSSGASPLDYWTALEKKERNRVVVGFAGGEPPPMSSFALYLLWCVVDCLMFVIWIALKKNWEGFKDL